MRKLLFILATVVLTVSCGPTKVATEARKTFKGDWVLNDVTYPNNTGIYNVTLFNDASTACFRGSTWSFVSNNNTGTYTAQGVDCTAGERYFRWSIDEENTPSGMFDFLLKPTDNRYKSTTGDQGFRLNLVALTETSMVWQQTVNLEGKPFVIRMNFTKL
ncbi:lipocalin family protein [Gillisia sp. Q332]|uniref:lipocalin family protein n=1 Tax=Gillisia xinjiangensis TaxID=3384765 RepID=UPI00391AA2B0